MCVITYVILSVLKAIAQYSNNVPSQQIIKGVEQYDFCLPSFYKVWGV